MVARIRKVVAFEKLGYRPIAAAVNAMGEFGNTWVAVGNEYFMKAREALKTGKYVDKNGNEIDILKELKEVEDRGGLALDFAITAEGEIKSRVSIIHPLGMFQMPERYIRPHNFVANYLYQVDVMDKSGSEATEAAVYNLRMQEFAYDVASIPQMLRSPGGKLIGQFRTYMIKQLEFMSTLRGKQIYRMIGLQLIMSGPRGAVYMLKTIPFLGTLGLLDDVEEWLLRQKGTIPEFAARGVGGLVGGDITAPATFQLPNRPEDIAGPFLGDAINLYKNVILPSLQSGIAKATGNPAPAFVTDEGIHWLKSLAAILTYWGDFYKSEISWESEVEVKDLESAYDFLSDKLQKPNIWMRDSQGNKAYQIGGLQDRMLLLLGIPPISRSRYYAIKRIWSRNMKIRGDNRKACYNKITNYLIKGQVPPKDLLDDAIYLYHIDPGQLPDAYMYKQMTPQQREVLRARIFDKAEAIDHFSL